MTFILASLLFSPLLASRSFISAFCRLLQLLNSAALGLSQSFTWTSCHHCQPLSCSFSHLSSLQFSSSCRCHRPLTRSFQLFIAKVDFLSSQESGYSPVNCTKVAVCLSKRNSAKKTKTKQTNSATTTVTKKMVETMATKVR